jgi:hypothetical protein
MNVACPSCGAPVEFRAGSSVVVVCGHCKFAVVRTDYDVRAVGKVAELALTDSPLAVGLRGTFRGVGYAIVGRQQLDHGQGPWDEWYCAFDDGRWGWLAEAQGRWYFTFAVAPPPIPYDYVPVGQRVTISNAEWVIAEKGRGRFVAAEGELPTAIDAGGYFSYIDLSGAAGTFGTLDYGHGSGQTPEACYLGWAVPFAELGLPVDPDAKKHAQMASGAGAPSTAAQTLACPQCGGNLDLTAPGQTKRIACPYCNSLLDASAGPLRWLSVLEQQKAIPKIPIGKKGKLADLLAGTKAEGRADGEWTVIGYMTRGCQVEGTWYFWDEYLLYERTQGFRFLLEQDGHWNLVIPVEPGDVEVGAVFDDVAKWNGVSAKKFGDVQAVVTRVLGEFYWEVEIGEATRATDYVSPGDGLTLSREIALGGRQEIAWSAGLYVAPERLWKAFGVDGKPPRQFGIAPNQPSPAKAAAVWMTLAGAALFAAWFFALGFNVKNARERTVFKHRIDLPLPKPEPVEGAPADEQPEAAFFSEPFHVSVGTNLEVAVETEVQNSYLWVGGALIDAKTGNVHEFELEPSHYAGVEDGESWSEGSPRQTTTISNIDVGDYVLRLQPVSEPESLNSATKRVATGFDVRVRNDVALAWPGILALLFILGVPIIAWVRVSSFEQRRWAESNVQ